MPRLPHLALAAVLLFTPIAHLTAQDRSPSPSPAELAEMETCHLTLENLKRYYAAEAELTALAKANPALATKLNAEAESIDVNTRMFQSEPTFVALLARHGFTPRQFTVVRFTNVQTIFALMAKQDGAPPAVLSGVHVAPGNIALYEQHGREIDALQHPKP